MPATKKKPAPKTISAKQAAMSVIRTLPESVTIEQIREELAIAAAIREGIADSEAGRVYTHDEIVNRPKPWRTI